MNQVLKITNTSNYIDKISIFFHHYKNRNYLQTIKLIPKEMQFSFEVIVAYCSGEFLWRVNLYQK